jgi:hypothetical protein
MLHADDAKPDTDEDNPDASDAKYVSLQVQDVQNTIFYLNGAISEITNIVLPPLQKKLKKNFFTTLGKRVFGSPDVLNQKFLLAWREILFRAYVFFNVYETYKTKKRLKSAKLGDVVSQCLDGSGGFSEVFFNKALVELGQSVSCSDYNKFHEMAMWLVNQKSGTEEVVTKVPLVKAVVCSDDRRYLFNMRVLPRVASTKIDLRELENSTPIEKERELGLYYKAKFYKTLGFYGPLKFVSNALYQHLQRNCNYEWLSYRLLLLNSAVGLHSPLLEKEKAAKKELKEAGLFKHPEFFNGLFSSLVKWHTSELILVRKKMAFQRNPVLEKQFDEKNFIVTEAMLHENPAIQCLGICLDKIFYAGEKGVEHYKEQLEQADLIIAKQPQLFSALVTLLYSAIVANDMRCYYYMAANWMTLLQSNKPELYKERWSLRWFAQTNEVLRSARNVQSCYLFYFTNLKELFPQAWRHAGAGAKALYRRFCDEHLGEKALKLIDLSYYEYLEVVRDNKNNGYSDEVLKTLSNKFAQSMQSVVRNFLLFKERVTMKQAKNLFGYVIANFSEVKITPSINASFAVVKLFFVAKLLSGDVGPTLKVRGGEFVYTIDAGSPEKKSRTEKILSCRDFDKKNFADLTEFIDKIRQQERAINAVDLSEWCWRNYQVFVRGGIYPKALFSLLHDLCSNDKQLAALNIIDALRGVTEVSKPEALNLLKSYSTTHAQAGTGAGMGAGAAATSPAVIAAGNNGGGAGGGAGATQNSADVSQNSIELTLFFKAQNPSSSRTDKEGDYSCQINQ